MSLGNNDNTTAQGACQEPLGPGALAVKTTLVDRPGPGAFSYYLDRVDNVTPRGSAEVSNWLAATCDKGKGFFIAAECENGHRFAKELVCAKEWCGVCGKNGSHAHNRRLARWLPKVQQFKTMGYFVFTIPPELRSKYRRKAALADLGRQVQELLRSLGFKRGLRRWHTFGDKSTRYHPHLNCLVDGDYLPPGKLKRIKTAYARLLEVGLADVHYSYLRSPEEMFHALRYVTRATFRDYEWDLPLALELRGFRNMVVWGRGQWGGEPCWLLADLAEKSQAAVEGLDVQAIESLTQKKCPVCGQPVQWGEALPIGLLNLVEKRSLGAGYYRLADSRASPGLPDEAKERLRWLMMVKLATELAAVEEARAEALLEAEYQGQLTLGGDAE
jgi:hypothetical protein